MRIGYCILLGEYVNAVDVEYRDCEALQIVCPACYEAVFKGVRPLEGQGIHYLSHYRSDASFDAECELRVRASTLSQREDHNAVSREQRLLYFMRVFSSALARDPFISYERGLEHAHSQLTRSRSFREFRKIHFENFQSGLAEAQDSFREFALQFLNELRADLGGVPKTGFTTEVQIRIASDLMKHLITEQGRPNYCTLFNHGAICLAACKTPENSSIQDALVSRQIEFFNNDLLSGDEDRIKNSLFEMRNTAIYPPYVREPSNYLVKVASEISHQMVGTLIRLPYFDLLRRYVTQKGAQTSP